MAELRASENPPPGWKVLVGTDIQPISEIAESIDRFGSRYLRRLFTNHEIASCGGSAPGLTARFAAKEATIKVLRPTSLIPRWRSIEVCRQPGGWVEIVLHAEAAELARQQHIGELSVSLSHGGDIGTATVIAMAGNSPPTKVP